MSNRKLFNSGDDLLDASDVWLVPSNGRVVIDERGNSVWQWPQADDPFMQTQRMKAMNAADLRVAEPVEIRRSRLPWMHESERPVKEHPSPSVDVAARPTRMR